MRRMLHFLWFDYQKRLGDENVYADANTEIQKWAERHLGTRFCLHNTSCANQGRVTQSGNDILLGHLTWDPLGIAAGKPAHSQRNWVSDNRLRPDALSHPNTYILTPWVPVFPSEWTDCMPYYEWQLEQAKLIFAICGPIWHERTLGLEDQTIQSRVKGKLVRLNMCVNPNALGIRKTAFNPVGRRKLLHVSNFGSYKGIDLLLDSTEGVAAPSIGSRALHNLPRGEISINFQGKPYTVFNLGFVSNGDDAQIRALVDEHDFYIHTSSMDAQPTAILENAVRGLIPIITPESGFDCEDAIYLTRDPIRNREIIRRSLEMPQEELQYRSARLREHVVKEHSWDKFFATISERILATAES